MTKQVDDIIARALASGKPTKAQAMATKLSMLIADTFQKEQPTATEVIAILGCVVASCIVVIDNGAKDDEIVRELRHATKIFLRNMREAGL